MHVLPHVVPKPIISMMGTPQSPLGQTPRAASLGAPCAAVILVHLDAAHFPPILRKRHLRLVEGAAGHQGQTLEESPGQNGSEAQGSHCPISQAQLDM